MKNLIIVQCILLGMVACADPVVRTWSGPAAGGALDAPGNWTPNGLASGDLLSVEASVPMTFSNGTDGLSLGGLSLTGGQSVTVTGQRISFSAGAVVSSDGGASRTNRFECPLELAGGMVTFSAVSNVSGCAVYDFTGVISGAGGLATGGDHSGTYHFRGANTYAGMTYFTNALAYHLWSDAALGAAGSYANGTEYFVPAGLRGTVSDRLAAPLYFHGIDTSEFLKIHGDQTRDMDFVAGTTNVLRGDITYARDLYSDIERWYVEENANVRLLGSVNLAYIPHLNVLSGGVLKFEGPVRVVSRLRPAPRSGGVCEFANTVRTDNESEIQIWGEGTTVFSHADAFTVASTKFTCSSCDSSVVFNGGHQKLNQFSVSKNLTVSSSDGTVLEIVNPGDISPTVKFTGSVGLQLDSGTITLMKASDTSGPLVVTNGAAAILSSGATWKGSGVTVGDGSSLRLCASDMLSAKAAVDLQGADGKLILDAGVAQTVAALTINSQAMASDKTYGASGADVNDPDHFGGTGLLSVIEPVSGETRTWCGAAGGKWSVGANWSPLGVPAKGDTLVFDASEAALSSENDLTVAELAGLTFVGGHDIEVSGNAIPLANGASVTASGATVVSLAAQLDLRGPVTFTATAEQAGHVVWRFDGGFTGSGSFTSAGDHTAEYHFTANSPAYTGNIILKNGAEYHAYKNLSFGTADGYTHFEVVTGTAAGNADKTIAKFAFHGIETSENFYWSGFYSHTFFAPENTTNVFNGTIDLPADALGATERWDFKAGSRTVFNGDIGLKHLAESGDYVTIVFLGESGSVIEMNGKFKCASSANVLSAASGLFVLNSLMQPGGDGICTYSSVLRLAQANLFNEGCYRFYGTEGTVDFDGHDQTFSRFAIAGGYSHYMPNTVFTSAKPATCSIAVASGVGLDLQQKFQGALSVEIASGITNMVSGVNTTTGAVSAVNGSCAYLTSLGSWSAATAASGSSIRLGVAALASDAVVTLPAGGRIHLDAGVHQAVSVLSLNGTAQTALKSYGSSASTADVKNDAYFSGSGVIYVDAPIVGVERTWTGLGTGLASASSWSPAGTPGNGDRLIISADGASLALENDLPDGVALGAMTFKNGTFGLTGSKPLRLLDTESGLTAENAQVTVSCGVETVRTAGSCVLNIVTDADSSFDFAGAIAGSAVMQVSGSGTVSFRGVNTFSGELRVVGGAFHAYGVSPFGTAAGKTVFSATTGACGRYHFHGVTIADDIDWYQTDVNYCGFFEEGTTNVLSGSIRMTGSHPRWVVGNSANVRIDGDVTHNDLLFIVDSKVDSDLVFTGSLTGRHFRSTGDGRVHFNSACVFNGTTHSSFWGETLRTFFFHADNIWGASSPLNAALLGMEGGTFDLNGHDQTAAWLGGHAKAVVRSADPATLHILQTFDGKALFTAFNGVFSGQAGLSVDGSSAVVTQTLTGVSTTSGDLTAKNGAVVRLTDTARWLGGGTLVVGNGSAIVISRKNAIDKTSEIRVYGTGKIILENGVQLRCAQFYVNDVCQPAAFYGAGSGATPHANIGGTGTLKCGCFGMSVIFR